MFWPCAQHIDEVPVPNLGDVQWVSQPSGGQWCSTILKVPAILFFFSVCYAFFFWLGFFFLLHCVNFLAHVLPCANRLKSSLTNIWRQKKRGVKKEHKRGNIPPFADRSRKCNGESKCTVFPLYMFPLTLMKVARWQRLQLRFHWRFRARETNRGASCLVALPGGPRRGTGRGTGRCPWKQQQQQFLPQPLAPQHPNKLPPAPRYLLLFTITPSPGLMLRRDMIKKQ